jgi:putative endonuclease
MVQKKFIERGDIGEKLAAEFLLKLGYEIISRNWRIRQGEIDIIAKDGRTIVFVEVKTAYGDKFGRPEEWVNTAKRRQIGKIAEAWIDKHNPEGYFFRFDVVALTKTPEGFDLNHIIDAFSL